MANLMMFFIYKMFGWKIILTNGGNFYRLFVGKKRKILSTFYKNNTVFPLFTRAVPSALFPCASGRASPMH